MISIRLKKIASKIDGESFLDIGCDHGYLAIELFKKNKIKKAILADVNEEPLNSAIKNIENQGFSNKCLFIKSNGFENIDLDFDAVAINGMGGRLIFEIIDAGLSKITNQKLILQANSSNHWLRKNLIDKGFNIIEEELVEDNDIIYNIMVVQRGASDYTNEEIVFGRYIENELNIKKLKSTYQHLQKVKEKIPSESEKHKIIDDKLNKIKLMIDKLK